MINIYFINKLSTEYKKEILKVLMECDEDFFPSLSSRRKNGNSKREKLTIYLDEKEDRPHLLIYYDNSLIGFSNFIHNYDLEYDGYVISSNFIDTICILKNYRNMGIGNLLYDYYEKNLPKDYKLNYISRETWSTNLAQLHLYEKSGYVRIKVIEDYRGKDVHSYTYLKKI